MIYKKTFDDHPGAQNQKHWDIWGYMVNEGGTLTAVRRRSKDVSQLKILQNNSFAHQANIWKEIKGIAWTKKTYGEYLNIIKKFQTS